MNILEALLTIFYPQNIIWFLLGSFIGIIAGALPGIGATMTMALLIPVTFYLEPSTGLITLIAAWAGAFYGGSISSILINTPGTGGNVATTLDGFPMARKGKARVALGISATSSMIGGLFGVASLILFSPLIARLSTQFGPSEYFLLAIFGLTIISTTIKGSAVRGLISAGCGLMISFIGYDIISGHIRYDFGTLYLQDGIHFIIVVLGVFAVAQILNFVSEKGAIAKAGKIEGSIIEGVRDTFRHWRTLLRSCAIGTLFGFAPGIGTSAASLISYGAAETSSKHPDLFGTGIPEGIVAAESANNAVQGGSLIPALTLGIPGSPSAAVFLSGLIMYGIIPGKDLFERNPELVAILFVALVLAQISFMIIGLSLTNLFAKITLIPVNILMPIVWLIAATGAYSLHNNSLDVLVAMILGFVSFFMKKFSFPVVPLLMAVILGPIAEKNFMRAMMLSDGAYTIFFTGIINYLLWALILCAFLIPLLRRYLESRKG